MDSLLEDISFDEERCQGYDEIEVVVECQRGLVKDWDELEQKDGFFVSVRPLTSSPCVDANANTVPDEGTSPSDPTQASSFCYQDQFQDDDPFLCHDASLKLPLTPENRFFIFCL